jgi:hypothetical protein
MTHSYQTHGLLAAAWGHQSSHGYGLFEAEMPSEKIRWIRSLRGAECEIEHLVSSDTPQEQLHRFTHALHQVFAFGRSKKHMIQGQLGRLEPTPSLKYRADEVMRNMPTLST